MLYKHLIKPLFFRFDAEKVHHFVTSSLKTTFKIPGIRRCIKSYCTVQSPNLEKEVFGLHFKNPVGLAAGFDKNADFVKEMNAFGFGFIETGAVTPLAQPGNPKPRLFRLPEDKALINRMGFNNKGVDYHARQLIKRPKDLIIGVNLGKNTETPNEKAADDYLLLFERLFDYADYFVINVSCPNITDLHELQDKDFLLEIIGKIQNENRRKPKPKPVLLKISPDLNNHQLDEVIEIVKESKLSGVIAINTTVSRDGLQTGNDKVKKIGRGGLSGLPLKQRALETIRYLSEKSGKAFPIIGVGGIFTPGDAKAMLEAGADLIQIYTGFIYEGPLVVKKINKYLEKTYKSA